MTTGAQPLARALLTAAPVMFVIKLCPSQSRTGLIDQGRAYASETNIAT